MDQQITTIRHDIAALISGLPDIKASSTHAQEAIDHLESFATYSLYLLSLLCLCVCSTSLYYFVRQNNKQQEKDYIDHQAILKQVQDILSGVRDGAAMYASDGTLVYASP